MRPSKIRSPLIVASAIAGCLAVGEVRAQVPSLAASDSLQIELAAAQAIKERVKSRNTVLDPRLVDSDNASQRRGTKRDSSIAAVLGAARGDGTARRACDGGSRTACRLEGAAVLVQFASPVVSTPGAHLRVRIMRETGRERVPVSIEDLELIFARDEQGWKFLRIQSVRIT
jgi:hypothetical protein